MKKDLQLSQHSVDRRVFKNRGIMEKRQIQAINLVEHHQHQVELRCRRFPGEMSDLKILDAERGQRVVFTHHHHVEQWRQLTCTL